MSEELLLHHCAPTLAGMKTGSLFSYKADNADLLKRDIRFMNKMLNSKGVYICLLELKGNRALIYVFRPRRLKRDLDRPQAKTILNKKGYNGESLYGYISYLSHRIITGDEFPHEIGLFLGYPIEDIKGFIANKGKNSIYTGFWKVYCNEGEAIKTFAKYKKCTDVYCRKFKEGLPITRLTISI